MSNDQGKGKVAAKGAAVRVTTVGKDKVQREASPRRSGRSSRSPRKFVVTAGTLARELAGVEGKDGRLVSVRRPLMMSP
jgi:hypothetical protein